MNDQPRDTDSLTPDEALALNEGEALLHNETVVYVEEVDEAFGVLDEGEVMVWAASEEGEGRGIPIKPE